jgi:hypothetical protein
VALRGAGQHGLRQGAAAGGPGGIGDAQPWSEHLAVSPGAAALRDLRRGRRERVRGRDRQRGTDLLRAQRREHARVSLRSGRVPAEGIREARRALESVRVRLLPADGAPQRGAVHAHVCVLQRRGVQRAVRRAVVRGGTHAGARGDQRGATRRRDVSDAGRRACGDFSGSVVQAGGHQARPGRGAVRRGLARLPDQPRSPRGRRTSGA